MNDWAVASAAQKWERMLGLLAAFREKNGHCNVSTSGRTHASLGRWVAAQRHRRKCGMLCQEAIRKLDEMGFCWSPTDERWMAMYRRLEAFRKKNGHCDVSEGWKRDPALAAWVANQRHAGRNGEMLKDRKKLLSKLGFSWAIYKRDSAIPVTDSTTEDQVQESEAISVDACEKLYAVGNGLYVQYSGRGRLPKLLQGAVRKLGDMPPFIPLPGRPVTFVLGEMFAKERKVAWKGKGPLPEEVLKYVCRNGNLPRYD